MKHRLAALAIAAGCTMFAFGSAALAQSSAVATIKARGKLLCPAPTSPNPGMLELDDQGNWKGMDAEICRSMALALFGEPGHVEFVPISWADRVTSVQTGALDVIVMSTAWTRSRDVKLGLQFSMPYLFGATQFMVPKSLGVKAVKELNGASVCAVSGTTQALYGESYLRSLGIKYTMIPFEKSVDAYASYKSGRCEALAGFTPSMAVFRASQSDPTANVVLPDVLSPEPDSIAVKQGNDDLLDVANWTLAAMVQADILGITQANVDAMVADGNAPDPVKYLLGVKPGVGSGFYGADDKWAYRITGGRCW